jgi:hypothetical protein
MEINVITYEIHAKGKFLKRFRAQLEHFRKKSNPIFSTMGVKQGGILPPILFVVLSDFIMRITVENKSKDTAWGLQNRFEDLDFMDDICLFSSFLRIWSLKFMN